MKKNTNKFVRIFFVLVVLTIVLVFFGGCIFSLSHAKIINPDDYKPIPNPGSQKLTDIGGIVLGTVNVIGAFVSVAMIMIIGIKYMTGSVEEKAQYKDTMIPYVIGAILLFSGTTLINCIYNMFN